MRRLLIMVCCVAAVTAFGGCADDAPDPSTSGGALEAGEAGEAGEAHGQGHAHGHAEDHAGHGHGNGHAGHGNSGTALHAELSAEVVACEPDGVGVVEVCGVLTSTGSADSAEITFDGFLTGLAVVVQPQDWEKDGRIKTFEACVTVPLPSGEHATTGCAEQSGAQGRESKAVCTDLTVVVDCAPPPPSECPADEPNTEDACDIDGLLCSYGEECCEAGCFPSYECICAGGVFGCYFTDACLVPE